MTEDDSSSFRQAPRAEVVQTNNPKVLRLGQLSIQLTRKNRLILLAGLAVLFAPLAFFLSEFDQTRGIVSLGYSRLWLLGLGIVLFLMLLLVTSQIFPKPWMAVAVSVTLALIAVVGLDLWAPKPDDTGVKILLECNSVPLIPIAWDKPISVLQLSNALALSTEVPMTVTNIGKPRKWPEDWSENFTPRFFARIGQCQFTNYGARTAFGFRAEFSFIFAQALKVPNHPEAIESGAAVGHKSDPVPISALDKKDGPYTFYIYNETPYWVVVSKPVFATILIEGKSRTIRLEQSEVGEPKAFSLVPKREN
jgi:hypothetical protein